MSEKPKHWTGREDPHVWPSDLAALSPVNRPKIVTEFVYPPIPDRRFDWSAVTEDYDGAPDSHCPIGHGRTEMEAIADLELQLEERA